MNELTFVFPCPDVKPYGVHGGLHCHHQNDLCIQMGSDEKRFNASLTMSGQSQKTGVQTSPFLNGKEKRTRIDMF